VVGAYELGGFRRGEGAELVLAIPVAASGCRLPVAADLDEADAVDNGLLADSLEADEPGSDRRSEVGHCCTSAGWRRARCL
jgi:hypothetical protein